METKAFTLRIIFILLNQIIHTTASSKNNLLLAKQNLQRWSITSTEKPEQEGFYNVYYMEDYCGLNIIVNPFRNPMGIIHLTRSPNYMNVSEHCITNVILLKGVHKLFITVKMIDLDGCSKSRLRINNGDIICSSKVEFGLENSLWSYFHHNQITIDFYHEYVLTYNKGFTLIYSALREAPCHSNEFVCENDRTNCILNHFVCDGHNNCGDRSDEDSRRAACGDKADFMEDYCGLSFDIGNKYRAGGTLILTRKATYDSMEYPSCAMILRTSGVYDSIRVYFTMVDIGNCIDQYLYIQTSLGSYKICNKSFSTREPISYISTGNIKLSFTKSYFTLQNKKGFSIIYTSYRQGICTEKEFKCANFLPNQCITLELACNQIDNCGDYSDESGCLLAAQIAGIVVGGLALKIIFIIIYIIRRRKKLRKKNNNSSLELATRY